MGTEGTLSSVWNQHLASEFVAKSADEELATMTAEPYVNEVPLMIGARGAQLPRLLRERLSDQIPPDMETVPLADDRAGPVRR